MAGKEQMHREKSNKNRSLEISKWLASVVALLPLWVFQQIKDTTTRDRRKDFSPM